MENVMPRERPYFGPAVAEDRQLRFTSVSSLQSFDEEGTEGGCQRKWFGEKVLGWPTTTSRGQAIGVEKHGEIEHFYLHGEDVRSPIARAGAHLLPARGPDIFIEQAFGSHVEKEWILRTLPTESDEVAIASMRRRLEYVEEQLRLPGGTVPLHAGGLDLVGFIDMRHQRGEYVDEEGRLRPERADLGLVVECIDHKFLGNVAKYAKSGEALSKTVQLTGYGRWIADVVPGVRHVRQSHVSYQTQRALTARKSTAIVPVDEIRRRWRRVDGLVEEMRHVALKGAVEDVRPNFNACETFGGCPHQSRCPRVAMTIQHRFQTGENIMSNGLFDSANSTAAAPSPGLGLFSTLSEPPAALPSLFSALAPTESDREARIAAEKARLLAEDAIRPCGTPGCGQGAPAGFVVGGAPCPACRGKGAAGLTAIVPPDAPLSTSLEDALPVPPEEVARIMDPALRAKVEEHARLAVEARAKADAEKAAAGQKTSGNCPGGKAKVVLETVKRNATGKPHGNKVRCSSCGRELPVMPSEDGSAIVPGHRMVEKKEAAAAPPPLPASIPPLPAGVPPLPAGIPALPPAASPPAFVVGSRYGVTVDGRPVEMVYEGQDEGGHVFRDPLTGHVERRPVVPAVPVALAVPVVSAAACARCGAVPPNPDHLFCQMCGAKLGEAAPQKVVPEGVAVSVAEIEILKALFADRAKALRGMVGPEALSLIRRLGLVE